MNTERIKIRVRGISNKEQNNKLGKISFNRVTQYRSVRCLHQVSDKRQPNACPDTAYNETEHTRRFRYTVSATGNELEIE